MPGKSLHEIEHLRNFMKLVYDIGEKTSTGIEHEISHVRSKLDVLFGKMSEILLQKVKILISKYIGK